MEFISFFYNKEYLIQETKSFLLVSSNIFTCLHPLKKKKKKTTKCRQALWSLCGPFTGSSYVLVAISVVINLTANPLLLFYTAARSSKSSLMSVRKKALFGSILIYQQSGGTCWDTSRQALHDRC